MDERRREQRVNPNARIEVVDTNSGQPLGVLMDISSGGFMISSNRQIDPQQLFQLSLVVPDQANGHQRRALHVDAEAVWQEPAPGGGHAWLGFQIIDISKPDADFITAMLNSWQR